MRLFVSAAVLAAIMVLAGGLFCDSPAAVSPVTNTVSVNGSGGRLDSGATLAPKLFGSWWGKFKRALKRIIEFIDGLIDDLRNHPEDEPPGGGGIAAWHGGAATGPVFTVRPALQV